MLDVVHIDPIQVQIRHLVEFSRMRKWIQSKIDIIFNIYRKKSLTWKGLLLLCVKE